jgi:hypothetical protein
MSKLLEIIDVLSESDLFFLDESSDLINSRFGFRKFTMHSNPIFSVSVHWSHPTECRVYLDRYNRDLCYGSLDLPLEYYMEEIPEQCKKFFIFNFDLFLKVAPRQLE